MTFKVHCCKSPALIEKLSISKTKCTVERCTGMENCCSQTATLTKETFTTVCFTAKGLLPEFRALPTQAISTAIGSLAKAGMIETISLGMRERCAMDFEREKASSKLLTEKPGTPAPERQAKGMDKEPFYINRGIILRSLTT